VKRFYVALQQPGVAGIHSTQRTATHRNAGNARMDIAPILAFWPLRRLRHLRPLRLLRDFLRSLRALRWM